MTSLNKPHNFFEKVQVSSTTFDMRIQWKFVSIGIALSVESNTATDVIQYSFDGVTVHGDMTPFQSSEGIIFDNRYEDDIYLRRATAGPPVTVRVEVWTTS